jgi:Xaa-Pro aminopeptidase
MIALSRATFPRGILSPLLDAIARAPIWADQVDYGMAPAMGGLLHECARRAAGDCLPGGGCTADGDASGHDQLDRAGHVSTGAVGVRIENLVVNREAAECSVIS